MRKLMSLMIIGLFLGLNHILCQISTLDSILIKDDLQKFIDFTEKNGDIEKSENKIHLISAVYRGAENTIKYMLKVGADINILNERGQNALVWANYAGNLEIVKLLLKRGIETQTNDVEDRNPFYFLMLTGSKEVALENIRENIRRMKEENVPDILSLLDGAIDKILFNNQKQDIKIEIVAYLAIQGRLNQNKHLFDDSILLKKIGLSRYTPISLASRFNNRSDVEYLLSLGVSANQQNIDRYHTSPLMEISRDGNTEIAKLLVANGAYVNYRDRYRDNVLNWAVYFGHFNFVKYLLEMGADFTIVGIDGGDPHNALEISERMKHKKITKLLKSLGAKNNKKEDGG